MTRFYIMVAVLCSGFIANLQAQTPDAGPVKTTNPPAGVADLFSISLNIDDYFKDYEPSFSKAGRANKDSEQLKFSRQKVYLNMADVQMDAQIKPIMDKANESAFVKKDYRKAVELFRKIIQEYPDDLYQIAEEGVFILAAQYAQLRILAFIPKELAYYRTLFDPAAKDLYTRAVKRYSIYDYKELARLHLATSYGDDALFALGNAALDNGQYDDARRRYEQVLAYHGLKDEDSDDIKLDRDQIWVRLAICYKYLGFNDAYNKSVAMVTNRADPVIAKLMGQLEKFKYNEYEVRQREGKRSVKYDALDDKSLSQPMPYIYSANQGEWSVPLPAAGAGRETEPESLPWATESDLIYKNMNVLFSRSILTGEINWSYGPGGTTFDWDKVGGWRTAFDPVQSILVHEGVVFASMFVYGPSLVAVDQYTGQKLWAKGPLAAQSEDDWLDRYQASPAAGRGMVVAGITHDDIRGRAHISSSADLAAFESRTGKLLWRTTIARVSPLKITQSRYPRKIRILTTSPVVKDGVVYHVTNAGAIVAVDAQTGRIIWLTRYPQNMGVLDNLNPMGRSWRNEPPLIRGNKLFVTPVDTGCGLMCLDKETGKIIWTIGANAGRMNGFTPDGLLCLTEADVNFIDPETGKGVWNIGSGYFLVQDLRNAGAQNEMTSADTKKRAPKGLRPGITGEGEDYWWDIGAVQVRPTITTDNKLYVGWMNMAYAEDYSGPVNTEAVIDLTAKKITDKQRQWWHPPAFMFHTHTPVTKRVVNETTEEFFPAQRMTFTRWGTPFEVDVTYNKIVVRYDKARLVKALGERKDLETLFGKAEFARKRGDVKEAINIFESCKDLLPSEEDNIRRNLNLRLYPLYTETAQWGYEAANLDMVEGACKKMGATASNPSQEIRALLSYAELHEKRGAWDKAVQVLQNASRHYWREPTMVSGLETGNRDELLRYAETSLTNLTQNIPVPYVTSMKETSESVKSMLGDYFLAVANVDADYVVETRTLIAQRLRQVLARAPTLFKKQYEDSAAQELAKYEGLSVVERLLWCWPETAAAKKKAQDIVAQSVSRTAVEKQAAIWRMQDLSEACGLGNTPINEGQDGLKMPSVVNTMAAGENTSRLEADNGDSEIVRLALAQKGQTQSTAHLMFVGGRRKSAYGNKFTVTCFDMQTNKKSWETRELLLYGKTIGDEGYETGFEEVFIADKLAIVHGRFDVIALMWDGSQAIKDGKKEKQWHFRVPVGFEIQKVDMCGNLLILCGRGSTLALSGETGEIVWDAVETGEYYAGPFFHKDMLFTVRNSPAEVSFRKIGSGRMLSRLKLAGLSTNRKHPLFMSDTGKSPAAAEAASAYPVAFAEGMLAVVDGRQYHLIDVDKMQLRWSTPATKLGPSMDPSYRMWINSGKLFVLKPYYSVIENAVIDTATGELLWRRREGGRKAEGKLQNVKDTAATEGAAKSTGLVFGSMVFVAGNAYGVRYEMGSTTVALVGMDSASGNEIMRVEEKGYEEPEAFVEPSWSKNCVTVRIQDGNKFEVWQVDVVAKKLVQRLQCQGYGRLGEYGETSAIWQGPYSAIWTYEKRVISAPVK